MSQDDRNRIRSPDNERQYKDVSTSTLLSRLLLRLLPQARPSFKFDPPSSSTAHTATTSPFLKRHPLVQLTKAKSHRSYGPASSSGPYLDGNGSARPAILPHRRQTQKQQLGRKRLIVLCLLLQPFLYRGSVTISAFFPFRPCPQLGIHHGRHPSIR